MVKIEIRGFENLSKALREKVVQSTDAAMPDAVQAGGMVIASEARILAPKKTSTLANSIDTREIQREGDTVIGKVGPSADIPYARIQEFGGVIHRKDKMLKVPITQSAKDGTAPETLVLVYANGQAYLMDPMTEVFHYILRVSVTLPAHPYLRPAADTKRGEAVQAMCAVIGQAVNR